jgi:toxin ParE1/3/4
VGSYRLSRRAKADLISIYHWSEEAFGRAQADSYAAQFRDAFALLAAFPALGRSADHVKRGLRRIDVQRHAIFYREAPGGVLILAVLHQRMRPDLHL